MTQIPGVWASLLSTPLSQTGSLYIIIHLSNRSYCLTVIMLWFKVMDHILNSVYCHCKCICLILSDVMKLVDSLNGITNKSAEFLSHCCAFLLLYTPYISTQTRWMTSWPWGGPICPQRCQTGLLMCVSLQLLHSINNWFAKVIRLQLGGLMSAGTFQINLKQFSQGI